MGEALAGTSRRRDPAGTERSHTVRSQTERAESMEAGREREIDKGKQSDFSIFLLRVRFLPQPTGHRQARGMCAVSGRNSQ